MLSFLWEDNEKIRSAESWLVFKKTLLTPLAPTSDSVCVCANTISLVVFSFKKHILNSTRDPGASSSTSTLRRVSR